jgi:membrane protease YdiL (CAAX protease family)
MEDDLLQGPENDQPTRDVIIILMVFFEAGLAPFSLFLGWLLGHPPLERFVWSLEDALWGAGAAVPLFVLFLAILNWPIGPLAKVKKFCEEDVVSLFRDSALSELALISLSAGVGEEMLFRGALQAAFAQWMGTAGGLVAASVIFGLMHAISMTYIVITGFLGLYLGGIWIANGNLLTVMVTHALYDFVALSYLIRIQYGSTE